MDSSELQPVSADFVNAVWDRFRRLEDQNAQELQELRMRVQQLEWALV